MCVCLCAFKHIHFVYFKVLYFSHALSLYIYMYIKKAPIKITTYIYIYAWESGHTAQQTGTAKA